MDLNMRAPDDARQFRDQSERRGHSESVHNTEPPLVSGAKYRGDRILQLMDNDSTAFGDVGISPPGKRDQFVLRLMSLE